MAPQTRGEVEDGGGAPGQGYAGMTTGTAEPSALSGFNRIRMDG